MTAGVSYVLFVGRRALHLQQLVVTRLHISTRGSTSSGTGVFGRLLGAHVGQTEKSVMRLEVRMTGVIGACFNAA
jgi:hypothetical protein